MEYLAVALGLLVLAAPAYVFFAVVAALAHATGLPKNAPPRLGRTAAVLGIAFLFVLLAVALELFAPGVAATRHGGTPDPQWTVAGLAWVAIVAAPLVLGRTWIRRLAPTPAIAWLATSAGLAGAVEFVLFDAVCRLLLGVEL